MDSWKFLDLKAPEMSPSSMPRAAPIIPNEKTANHSLQLKTPAGSPRSPSLKTLTGFLMTPPAMMSCCRRIVGVLGGEEDLLPRQTDGIDVWQLVCPYIRAVVPSSATHESDHKASPHGIPCLPRMERMRDQTGDGYACGGR